MNGLLIILLILIWLSSAIGTYFLFRLAVKRENENWTYCHRYIFIICSLFTPLTTLLIIVFLLISDDRDAPW